MAFRKRSTTTLFVLTMTTTLSALTAIACASNDKLDDASSGSLAGSGGQLGIGGSSGGSSGGSGNTGSDTGGSSGTGGDSSGTDSCDVCVEAKCGAQTAACEADAECLALTDCLDLCQDEACATQCSTTHPAGQPLLQAANSCLDTQCPNECGGGSAVADACDTCVESSCAAEVSACDGDPSCTGLWDCYSQCQDDACIATCETQFAAGMTKSEAVDTCAENKCPNECPEG